MASASESLEVELDDDYAMEVDEESKPVQKAASRKRKSRSVCMTCLSWRWI